MDRASGSGVFARDPDAMLDLIELDVTEALRKQEENKAVCATCKRYLDAHYAWQDELSQDDLCSQVQMQNYWQGASIANADAGAAESDQPEPCSSSCENSMENRRNLTRVFTV